MIKNFRKKSCTGKLISLVLITSVCLIGLTGCSSSKSVSSNSNTKDLTASSADKGTSTTSDTQTDSKNGPVSPTEPTKPTAIVDTKTASDKNVSSKVSTDESKKTQVVQKSTPSSSELYKNTNLRLSITFPASWNGKYSVKETTQGIFVYFKPKQKVSDGQGLFFCILKKTKDLNESMFDSINGKREINVNGTSYLLGGPTDISFPDNNAEFSTFRKLKEQIPDVINSIKSIK